MEPMDSLGTWPRPVPPDERDFDAQVMRRLRTAPGEDGAADRPSLGERLGTATMDGAPQVALSNVRQSDVFQVAYFGAGGSVEIRIKNTEEDYYRYTFTPVAGYNVSSAAISALIKVGNPDLASASGLQVTHSGSGSVILDGIRVHSPEENDNLILRQRFTTPFKKVVGMPLDIEVPMVINL